MSNNILIIPSVFLDKYNQINIKLDLSWYEYSKKIGITLFPIISTKEIKKIKNVKGIIFTGSGDIYSLNKSKENLVRDNYEKEIIKYAKKNKIKCLFVCRSFQHFCFLKKFKIKKVNNHVKKNHLITNQKKMRLNVNSFHKYGIKRKKRLSFKELFLSSDGNIELMLDDIFLGMMFHPERKNLDQKKIDKLIKNHFNI
tara:strand:+ start:438 stop:1031 length:594 start_codon:yes stop_codon:yes gene_type:complete